MLDLLNLLRNFDLIMISFRLFANLGIGIGTDIINASISSSIMPMDRKRWWLMMKRPHQQSHVVTWQIKSVISPLSQVLWTPNVAGWWLKMREHHALWSRDHVTNNKTYISTFTRPMAPKLSQVVTYGSGDNGVCNVSSNSNSNAEFYKWPFFSKAFRYKRIVAISMKLQWEQEEHVKQLFH